MGNKQMDSLVRDKKKSLVDSKLNISKKIYAQEIMEHSMGEHGTHKHRKIAGYLLATLGFLACPCHLLITLPMLVTLLSGTTLGILIGTNKFLTFIVFLILYVIGIVGGGYLLTSTQESKAGACTICDSNTHRITGK